MDVPTDDPKEKDGADGFSASFALTPKEKVGAADLAASGSAGFAPKLNEGVALG